MTRADPKDYGDAIIAINHRLLSARYPYDDRTMSSLVLHIILGQLPNVLLKRYNIFGNEQDLRIHGTILSPSGTNKGAVFGYMSQVSKELGLKYKTMGQFTDAALVGTPNIKREKVDALDEFGEPMIDEKGKPIKETITVEDNHYGALHPMYGNNILAWSEGSQLLDIKSINLNQNTMNNLQQVMNPMGTPDNIVSRSTGLGEIAFNASCSLFLTTYKPVTLTEKVISTGFLQRQIVLIREPTGDARSNIAKNATAGLMRRAPVKETVDTLVSRLQTVNEYVGIMPPFEIPDGVREVIIAKQDNFHLVIKNSNILVRQKLGEFATRWSTNIFYNVIFHHTMLRLNHVVSKEDVLYASDFMLPIWQDFTAFLENALLMDKKETEAVAKQYAYVVITYNRLLKRIEERKKEMTEEELEDYEEVNGYVRRSDLIHQLALDWARSPSSVNDMFRQIEDDLFNTKEIYDMHPDFIPDDADEKFFEGVPKIRWIKMRPGAMRIINIK